MARAELAAPIEGLEEGGFLEASFAPKGVISPNLEEVLRDELELSDIGWFKDYKLSA